MLCCGLCSYNSYSRGYFLLCIDLYKFSLYNIKNEELLMQISFFLDESGNMREKNNFLIGGYFTTNSVTPKQWEITCTKYLTEISNKYPHIDKEILYHRTKLKSENYDVCSDVTTELFNQVIDPHIKFISIKGDPENRIYSEEYLYIQMMATLVTDTLYKVYSDLFVKEKIDVVLCFATRRDMQTESNIIEEKYEQIIIEAIKNLSLRYAIPQDHLSIKFQEKNATRYTPLVLADYFCNIAYEKNKAIYQDLENSNRIYMSSHYGIDLSRIEFATKKKDFFTLLSLYTYFKRIEKSSKKDTSKPLELLKDVLTIKDKDERYLVTGLKSLLETIEYESNTLRNYSEIIKTYQSLIELIKLIKLPTLENEVLFMLNTELLAVANHSGYTAISEQCINTNNALLPKVYSNLHFLDYIWVFFNISSVYLQNTYDSKEMIKTLNNAVTKHKTFIEWKNMFASDLDKNSPELVDSAELGRFYGTLGQAYMLEFMITEDQQDYQQAEAHLNQAMDILKNDIRDIQRECNYLMHLYRIAKNEDKFLETLATYAQTISVNNTTIEDQIKTILDNNDLFSFLELLIYGNRFDTPKAKMIRDILKSYGKNIPTYFHNLSIILKREWALLLYKTNSGSSNGAKKFSSLYSWLKQQQSPLFKLSTISLKLVEFIITGKPSILEIKEMLKGICDEHTTFKNIFDPLLKEDPKEKDQISWAYKVLDKIYY